MKSHAWKEEVSHLTGILAEFDQQIQKERNRSKQEGLEDSRQDFLRYSVEQLKAQKASPYFGRLDVTFEQDQKAEKMYIGSSTLFDDQDNVLIYDWRAPIASLFYEGTLGQLDYQTPNGLERAHASLKRDIVIRNQELQSIYDVESEESRLMETLSASSNRDGRLEGITATIQKEQNEIIRHKQKDWLIVNGCAGSGKTTILLQRIAYLMYQARQETMSDMLLLSRNQLFANYISHVIPHLTGGSELFQRTIWQKTQDLFREFQLHHQVEVVAEVTEDWSWERAYLPDSEWVDLIVGQMADLSLKDIHFKPIYLKGYRLFSLRDFQKLSEQTNPNLTNHQQLTQIQGALERSLKRRLNKFFASGRAMAYFERLSNMQIELLLDGQEFVNESDYYQNLGMKLFEKEIKVVEEQIEKFAFVNSAKHLHQWIKFAKARRKQIGQTFNVQTPIKLTEEGYYQATPEGIRVLEFIATTLAPIRCHSGYTHLFIDEIQDVSLLLMGTLSRYYFRSKFTVVGDEYQGFGNRTTIFRLLEDLQGTPGQMELAQKRLDTLFPKRDLESRQLAISYRCTSQITRFSNGILDWELDKNVFPRNGKDPQVILTAENQDYVALEKVIDHLDDYLHTVGIICSDRAQAKELQAALKGKLELPLLEDGGEYLGNRVIVTTIDVAKGMEFDAVIIMDVTKENYPDQSTEKAKLYTSCTRAKHDLILLAKKGELSPLVKNNKAPYQMVGE